VAAFLASVVMLVVLMAHPRDAESVVPALARTAP
jgi:hypothetical protein